MATAIVPPQPPPAYLLAEPLRTHIEVLGMHVDGPPVIGMHIGGPPVLAVHNAVVAKRRKSRDSSARARAAIALS